MAGEFLQGGIRILRTHHLHQFHLVELVLADHAARVAAVGTRLAAEARRVCDIFQRQLVARHDLFAHHIGHRHFGGRDQIEVFLPLTHLSWHLEQVFLELG